ncbi:MAG: hypothetical protein QM398_01895 [Thermoproteota archaeon]|nr:hypothetical protein [Thermoproteota archaeon]
MPPKNQLKKRKTTKIQDLPKKRQKEIFEQFELANSILANDNLKMEVEWGKRESKMQKRIHKKDGWRAYTV